ncbi:polysaccharide export outer membrane protein [Pseudoduganella flava]|uniref:Polysaccharide export outer membrane protein n=1 Tax=Pseudoduganella flava TaxID=871742 RepID=A0A562Q4W7_9BURK|nr:polysaccharide export protein EpsE [Pseudoduganella flava]QGZ41779.1 polysaccharide export protein EpsE [Pseudoduganella flava]TWI51783.1 polysaccharide export outer membrane protein [Pseudoduganella flava]
MKRFVMWMLASVMTLAMGWAMAADATLGAGDVVKISVYGSPDLTTETRISQSGVITFPLVGQVQLGGLELPAAEKKLAGLLESGGFIRKPQVTILVTAISSQQVSVLGQVNRPGRFPIEGKRTMLDMLALAGGTSIDGADTVTLIRKRSGNVTKETVDIVEMMRTGELQRDVELGADDILYVERAPRFYIYGEVQRPGAFKLERSMTVLQALAVGGGLTPRGTERGMRIKRRDAQGKIQVIDAKHDDLLLPDDIVYVKESLF